MGPDHEQRAVEQVTERLRVRFPDRPPEAVTALVDEIHRKVEGPIRDFVPILVEREARRRLAQSA